jgi:hypothetical protein
VSPYPSQIEPSPVDSNGTESTEIEEDAQEDPELKSPTPTSASELTSPDIEISSPRSMTSVSFLVELCLERHLLVQQERPQINTQLPARARSDSQDDAPQSVIHVPSGFKDFREGQSSRTPSETDQPPLALRSPTTPEAAQSPNNKVSVCHG